MVHLACDLGLLRRPGARSCDPLDDIHVTQFPCLESVAVDVMSGICVIYLVRSVRLVFACVASVAVASMSEICVAH